MKNIWVLSVKTSLPNVCESVSQIKTEMCAFESFEAAKQALQNKLKEFAFSKNSMFDGNGNIRYFNEYIENAYEPDEDEECFEDDLTKDGLLKIQAALKSVFEGKNGDISEFDGYYTDYMIAVEVNDGVMTMYGEDDGPINGYNPGFACNMFDMTDEKDYFLYIDDRFGQDDATSELYIDLKKVELK